MQKSENSIFHTDDLEQIPAEDRTKSTGLIYHYIKARLARIEVQPEIYSKSITQAILLSEKIPHSPVPLSSILFEKGICCSMDRRYKDALSSFSSSLKESGADVSFRIKTINRLAQTCLSLGNYSNAEKHLEKVRGLLVDKKYGHESAVYQRHLATLGALEIDALKGISKKAEQRQELIEIAKRAAKECIRLSSSARLDGGYPPDHLGIGVGHLKLAQVCWFAEDYPRALTALKVAINNLRAFPNSRWWLMSCYDLQARCFARSSDLSNARNSLKSARHIFGQYRYKDPIRECELDRTDGFIAIRENRIEHALKFLGRSISFCYPLKPETSNGVALAHIKEYSIALLRNSQLREAKEFVRAAENIRNKVLRSIRAVDFFKEAGLH